MDNDDIGRILDEIGDVLEIDGANPFKVRAHRNAAEILRTLQEPLQQVQARGQLLSLPSVGPGIAKKLAEIIETGDCAEHRALLQSPSGQLLTIVKIPGIGPKRARQFQQQLAINSLDELEAAAQDGRLRELVGVGERSERRILDGIGQLRSTLGRLRLDQGTTQVASLAESLAELPEIEQTTIAGDLRRRCETVVDVAIVALCSEPDVAIDAFKAHPSVKETITEDPTGASVRLHSGLRVDLRCSSPSSHGAAVRHHTGSKGHTKPFVDGLDSGVWRSASSAFSEDRKTDQTSSASPAIPKNPSSPHSTSLGYHPSCGKIGARSKLRR